MVKCLFKLAPYSYIFIIISSVKVFFIDSDVNFHKFRNLNIVNNNYIIVDIVIIIIVINNNNYLPGL